MANCQYIKASFKSIFQKLIDSHRLQVEPAIQFQTPHIVYCTQDNGPKAEKLRRTNLFKLHVTYLTLNEALHLHFFEIAKSLSLNFEFIQGIGFGGVSIISKNW